MTTNRKIIIAVGALGVLWTVATYIDLFGWTRESFWELGFLLYPEYGFAVAVIFGIIVGLLVGERRIKRGLLSFISTVGVMILGLFVLFIINQMSTYVSPSDEAKKQQEFQRQVNQADEWRRQQGIQQ